MFVFNERAVYPEYLTDPNVLVCPSASQNADFLGPQGMWVDAQGHFDPDRLTDASYIYLGFLVQQSSDIHGVAMKFLMPNAQSAAPLNPDFKLGSVNLDQDAPPAAIRRRPANPSAPRAPYGTRRSTTDTARAAAPAAPVPGCAPHSEAPPNSGPHQGDTNRTDSATSGRCVREAGSRTARTPNASARPPLPANPPESAWPPSAHGSSSGFLSGTSTREA